MADRQAIAVEFFITFKRIEVGVAFDDDDAPLNDVQLNELHHIFNAYRAAVRIAC